MLYYLMIYFIYSYFKIEKKVFFFSLKVHLKTLPFKLE